MCEVLFFVPLERQESVGDRCRGLVVAAEDSNDKLNKLNRTTETSSTGHI